MSSITEYCKIYGEKKKNKKFPVDETLFTVISSQVPASFLYPNSNTFGANKCHYCGRNFF